MAGTEITPKKLGQSVKRLPKENSNEEKSNEERFPAVTAVGLPQLSLP